MEYVVAVVMYLVLIGLILRFFRSVKEADAELSTSLENTTMRRLLHQQIRHSKKQAKTTTRRNRRHVFA